MENASVQTVIAADVEITGTLKSAGSVRLDGKLEGELHCEKDACIGKSASVKGNLHAASVVVEGAIHGNISARDRIELKATARLTGDIKAKRLVVEEGVSFVGRSEVNPSPSAPAAQGMPSPSAAAPTSAPAGASESQRQGIFGKR